MHGEADIICDRQTTFLLGGSSPLDGWLPALNMDRTILTILPLTFSLGQWNNIYFKERLYKKNTHFRTITTGPPLFGTLCL